MGNAALVAAGVALMGAIVAAVFLPSRAAETNQHVHQRRRGEPRCWMTSGRPRKPETDAAILDAALAVFGEAGYEGMTVEAVAARAGVGKATIYRRWSSKDDLIIGAIQEVLTSVEVPAMGDLRTTLITMVRGAITLMKTTDGGIDLSPHGRLRWRAGPRSGSATWSRSSVPDGPWCARS